MAERPFTGTQPEKVLAAARALEAIAENCFQSWRLALRAKLSPVHSEPLERDPQFNAGWVRRFKATARFASRPL